MQLKGNYVADSKARLFQRKLLYFSEQMRLQHPLGWGVVGTDLILRAETASM
jgi:hypothetical protein